MADGLQNNNMNKIGIMHGRLSPPISDKIQSFPWHSWRDEFFIAKEIGLSTIEFIFDDKIKYRENPLWSDESITEIKNIVKETEVSVYSFFPCFSPFLFIIPSGVT